MSLPTTYPVVRHAFLAVVLCAALGALILMSAGCGDDDDAPSSSEAQLERLMTSQWNARYPGIPGGMTMLIITPQGTHFATTIAGARPGSHFRAGSTTKTFTAASIMLLDQRGALDIDDVLTATIPGTSRPYLPATPEYAIAHKEQITIRELLDHRAGVFDVTNVAIPATAHAPYAGQRYIDWAVETFGPTHTFTLSELSGVIAADQLEFTPPGETFHYSDTGYTLLATIVEQVSGKTFAQFVGDEFLVPNGLGDTTFPDDGRTEMLPAPFIAGMTLSQGQLSQLTHRNVSWGIGEGNVVTTPANLSKWIRLLLEGKAGVEPRQIARMSDCLPTGERHVAYGLGLECDVQQTLGLGHNGGITDILTSARHAPQTDVTVVIFSNLYDADDSYGELAMFYETAGQALAILGY